MALENIMRAPYALDIANSEDWKEGDWFLFTIDRLVKMRSKRAVMDQLWNELEVSSNSVSFYDNQGVLHPNIPLEKNLCEIYMGRTKGKVQFDILPDGQANVEELQPTKYAMKFFMDGSRGDKESFWRENNHLRSNKGRMGSGIFFTGIRNAKDKRYQQKEGTIIQSDTDLQNKRNFDDILHSTWFFFPKSIHPKDFYIDDNAWGQPDVQYAEDCIYKERVSASEFNNRYKDNKACINQNMATYWNDIAPKNKDDQAEAIRHVILHHYLNRVTKNYIIMINESYILYNGYYLYNDGKLPFVNIQHYPNPNRFIGEGIPERINYLKIYKSELFDDILQGAAMNNSINMVVGNDDQIGQDWQVGGRGLNLWRTSGGADKVQPISTSINLGFFTAIIQLIDQQIIADTGINPLEHVNPQSDKVGIVEMMEANKAVRHASVDENYEIGLDEALTMMLDRIKQFAPSLMSEKVKNDKGDIIKVIFPKIRIDDMEIEKIKGETVYTESIGKYGYFDLKPDVIQGVGVKVTTASTNSVLPILERQKVNEFVTNYASIGNIAALDQTGQTLKQLNQRFPIDKIMDWMGDAYDYDINGLKANSEKDKIKQENLEKLKKLQEALTINPPTNAQTTPTPQQAPTQGMPMQQPSQVSGGAAPAPQTVTNGMQGA